MSFESTELEYELRRELNLARRAYAVQDSAGVRILRNTNRRRSRNRQCRQTVGSGCGREPGVQVGSTVAHDWNAIVDVIPQIEDLTPELQAEFLCDLGVFGQS